MNGFADIDFKSSCAIYGIYNNAIDKWYVGSSFDVKNRIKIHINSLKKGNHNCTEMQADYNLHHNSFSVKIFEFFKDTTRDYVLEKEYIIIKSINCVYNRNQKKELLITKEENLKVKKVPIIYLCVRCNKKELKKFQNKFCLSCKRKVIKERNRAVALERYRNLNPTSKRYKSKIY